MKIRTLVPVFLLLVGLTLLFVPAFADNSGSEVPGVEPIPGQPITPQAPPPPSPDYTSISGLILTVSGALLMVINFARSALSVNPDSRAMQIQTYITEHPGCGESDLVKYLGYSRGSTAHQIQKLIRNNRIREVSYRSTIRYYPAGVPETETDLLSAASAKEKPAAIIKALGGGPLTLSALSKETGYSLSSLRWHLTRLEEDGVISAEKKGKNVWYFLRK
ncbi:MAG: winged helix-turn-helix transcriptional regulator [Methanocorpusculum sp.]|nr:winged helix-turn-helix transcriptional regulator [Methanocorpusculum sp.]